MLHEPPKLGDWGREFKSRRSDQINLMNSAFLAHQ